VSDFSLYFGAARIGLQHGFSHIYDLGLQHAEFYRIHPPSDRFDSETIYVTPPPMAWLIVLLTPLGYGLAFYVWLALLIVAYFAVGWWALGMEERVARAAMLLVGAITYPFLISIRYGQVAILMGLAVLAAWALLRRGRPLAAGAVLSVLFVKPQVAHLVPVALLVWGARRTALAAAGGVAALLAVSLLSLGAAGVAAWRTDLGLENVNVTNQVWTPALLVGIGWAAYTYELAAAAAVVLVAWLRRGRDLEPVLAAALAGSLIAAPYHHSPDSFALVIAFWIAVAGRPPRWQWPWLAFGALAAFLEPPLGPRPLMVFAAGWLLILLFNAVRARRAGR